MFYLGIGVVHDVEGKERTHRAFGCVNNKHMKPISHPIPRGNTWVKPSWQPYLTHNGRLITHFFLFFSENPFFFFHHFSFSIVENVWYKSYNTNILEDINDANNKAGVMNYALIWWLDNMEADLKMVRQQHGGKGKYHPFSLLFLLIIEWSDWMLIKVIQINGNMFMDPIITLPLSITEYFKDSVQPSLIIIGFIFIFVISKGLTFIDDK